MIGKQKFIFAFLILTAFVLSCSTSEEKATPDILPNVILLMGDDHGWDETGYNGHPFVKTPVLDEMAASGLRFDRFYSGHSSCSPTRGSFMTGRHPNRYGTFSPNWSIRPEEYTIAHLMKEAGYTTAHFGKWHLGPVKKESPTNPGAMGFDEWLGHDNFFELNPVLSRNGAEPEKIEGESSQILIDEAKRFIKEATQKNQPWFINVWFGSPHEPYSGLPEDLALYDNLPAQLNEKQVSLTSNETGQKTTRPLGDVLRERYAEITAMDRAIGDLRNFLKSTNQKENTIVWYCGDNGTPPSAARTGMTVRGQKGSLYEGGVLVPGVLEWPAKIKNPAITQSVAVTTDFMPTLAGLTGIELSGRPIDGVNLLPVLEAPEKEREAPLFFWMFEAGKVFNESALNYIEPQLQEGTTPLVKLAGDKATRSFRNLVYDKVEETHFIGERSMLKGPFKLFVNDSNPDNLKLELFDIEKDRAETTNIADQNPELVQEMMQQMRLWQHSVLNSLTGADYK